MSKRFTLVSSAVACAVALLVACSGKDGAQPPAPGFEGEMQVSVQGLSEHQIQSMVITAQPANITRALTYTDAGTFTGTLVLPVGTQTLTANGYAYVAQDGGPVDSGTPGDRPDAGSEWDGGSGEPPPPPPRDAGSPTVLTLVASGTASVDIVANTTSAVSMNIYDLTPPLPQPDIGPMIRSATNSSTSVGVNEFITLSVDALDLNGDPLTYDWTSDCPSSRFTNPSSAFTQWYSPEPAGCTLRVTVSSRGLSTSMALSVVVFGSGTDGGPSTGGAQVTGNYIPRPEVYAISAFNLNHLPYTMVSRYDSAANLPLLRSGTTYQLEVFVAFGTSRGNRDLNLSASCGTLERGYDSCAESTLPSCTVQYNWTTPPAGNVCQLTASALNETLTDSFTVGVPVR
ncbi:hypothetical protein [Pyxidicoccus trucidator]|uniref:hypothetical protein n=1 Tax=Pyxidicoccus trucidator TaxID=2709662 RepID=UPI0013DC093D|nr:hypothetical protein [Pyxidicoccus trucidator]